MIIDFSKGIQGIVYYETNSEYTNFIEGLVFPDIVNNYVAIATNLDPMRCRLIPNSKIIDIEIGEKPDNEESEVQ